MSEVQPLKPLKTWSHLAARRRAVVLEHVDERVPQQLQVVVRKPSAFGQLGGDETVGAI